MSSPGVCRGRGRVLGRHLAVSGPDEPAGTLVASRSGVDDPSLSKLESADKAGATTASRVKARVKTQPTHTAVWARYANLALGLWLQISSFAWPHSDETRVSAWLPGLLISVLAVLSMSAPPLRWLNGVSAIWLLAWTAASAAIEPLTYWNGIACGVLVFLFATVPSKSLASDWVDE